MADNDKKTDMRIMEHVAVEQNSNPQVSLLRLCTLLLAAVSFWATAQGMTVYVFKEEWQAYAASLAIQGLLVGLNFYLPSFWSKANGFLVKSGMFILAVIITFSSSWFSYLYIAEKVFEGSWDVKSSLLAQEEYRNQLYQAQDYVKGSLDELTLNMGIQVSELYKQAQSVEQKHTQSQTTTIDWMMERSQYASADRAVSSEMGTIIDAMEQAASEPQNIEFRTHAETVLQQMKVSMESSYTRFQENVETAKEDAANANQRVQNAQANLRRAVEGTDITPLTNALLLAQQSYERAESQLTEYQKQRDECMESLNRVAFYESQLSIRDHTTYNTMLGALRAIQNELFTEEPNEDLMIGQAINVYDQLQNSMDLAGSTEEGTVYMAMQNRLQKLTEDIRMYGNMKNNSVKFSEMLTSLSEVKSGDSLSSNVEENSALWTNHFTELKSVISSLPVYQSNNDTTETWKLFDRAESISKLDYAMQKYIADHNAAEQGIIYLFGPYWDLAAFALALALFLDVSGFITGILVHILEKQENTAANNQRDEEHALQNRSTNDASSQNRRNLFRKETVVETLNQYVILTGDFTRVGDKDLYICFDRREAKKIPQEQDHILEMGIYQNKEDTLTSVIPQDLQFALNEKTGEDGIYQNSYLSYNEHMLTISETEKGNEQYLTNVDSNVPVYRLKGDMFGMFPAKELKKVGPATIVLALNTKGTMVAAVYIVFPEEPVQDTSG